jgi:membrane protease subunit (stomatin/prohibitin family)
MGLIKAFAGGIVGSFGDQWKDFYTVPGYVTSTTALTPAVKRETNESRGSNTSASTGIVTNGSKFVVPEGYALVLIQDGAFTGFISEPGGYIWNTESLESKSIFAGGGVFAPLIKNSWERFKFGGRPQSEQVAIYVSLQELANNKFASASEIYWDDNYLDAQVGALVRGSYTLKIVDPLSFIKQFVPNKYLKSGEMFDFTDINNAAAQQLFNEVVGSLAAAFANYVNSPDKQNRMSRIQQDSVGFALSLSETVESSYNWKRDRGLEIVNVAIVSIEYDESTKEVLKTAQRADALKGSRGNSNLQASVAAGIEAAGSTEGSAGILGIGFAAGAIGLGGLQQQDSVSQSNVNQDNLVTRIQQLKEMLDSELISQSEYEAAKAKLLGI